MTPKPSGNSIEYSFPLMTFDIFPVRSLCWMGVLVARRPMPNLEVPEISREMTLLARLAATSRLMLQSPHLGPLPLAFRSSLRDSGVEKSQSGLVAFQLRSMSKFLLDPVALTLTLFLRRKASACCLFLGRAPSQVTLGWIQSPLSLVILVEKELSVRV